MKKALLLAAVAAICVGALTGCGTQKPVKETVVIGLDDNFAPMGFRDEKNEIVGLDIDLAREATKRMGSKVIFKPIDWGAKEAEIKSGRIDAIWNCFSVTEDRKATYGLSKPYINNAQWIVTLADSKINKIADLKGKVVGTQDDATGVMLMDMEKNKELKASLKDFKKYPDFPSAYLDLNAGRVDAIIVDAVLAGYYSQKAPGKYRKADETFGDEVIAVGFRKDDKELIAAVDKALDAMKKDGTAKKISEKWLGADVVVYEK